MKKNVSKRTVTLESLDAKIDKLAEGLDAKIDRVEQGLSNKIDRVARNLDDLAIITKKHFDLFNQRFELVDKRFEEVKLSLDHIDARLAMLEHDVGQIRKNLIEREAFEDIVARVENIEQKLGIRI